MCSSKQSEINNQITRIRYLAIDSYVTLEGSRLDGEQLQKELRTNSLQGIIVDSLGIYGENDFANLGEKKLLPSSFIGGPRDMRKRLNKEPFQVNSSTTKDFRNDYGTPEKTIGTRKLIGEDKAHEPPMPVEDDCVTSISQIL
ncbi:hypothetical protein ACP275_09G044100 [Erythranthe tilingii]